MSSNNFGENINLSRDDMNRLLFQACVNLFDAGKNLSYFDQRLSLKLFGMADKISSIINAPERKITDDEMNDLLNDILNSDT